MYKWYAPSFEIAVEKLFFNVSIICKSVKECFASDKSGFTKKSDMKL